MSDFNDTILKDSDANDVRLGDLWADHPVALVFMRHYGCIYCREHVIDLKKAAVDIDKSGGEVVVVGMGTPAHADYFKNDQQLPFKLLVDQSREAYKIAGMKRGTLNETTGPKQLIKSIRAFRKGARQGKARQDIKQFGGVVVVAPGGQVSWTQRAQTSSDNASAGEIVGHLAAAVSQPLNT